MRHNRITRRSFLKGFFMTAGAAVLAHHDPKPVYASYQPNNKGLTGGLNSRNLSITDVLPRNETLYMNALQWGAVKGWNPYSSVMNNSMAIGQEDNVRVTMFETPYLFNMIDGKQYPLLADGPWLWDAGMTYITFDINPAARWSDDTPVTAYDVAYTWTTNVNYGAVPANTYSDYIDSIVAVDAKTVKINAKLNGEGKAINPLMVAGYLSSVYVVQKAWTQTLEARTDEHNFLDDPAEDVVYSGPYHKLSADDLAVVLVRDDNYWGQHSSKWGKLPTPKYIAHILYSNDLDSLAALKAGETDVSQLFINNVQVLWTKDLLPISTYKKDAPYGICASLPTAYFNLSSHGLDQVAVRKAIAIAVDYNNVIANAITNQSPRFDQTPRSLMNPTPGEQALFDHDQVEDLQWLGNDIAGAKKLLDDAGIVDTNGDGWREYNGQTLQYVATCPKDWRDWQAAIEDIAAAGKTIGIQITTNYPDFSEYQDIVVNWPLPETGYDIFMFWTDGSGPSQPWSRVEKFIHSKYALTTNNWSGNLGGYINTTADSLIDSIPGETDPAVVKQAYTDLVKIYLTDVPSFTLMYRPEMFHTVNESVWTNFPHEGDGANPPIPPLSLIDGWSIAGLYNLSLKPQKPDLSTSTITVDRMKVNKNQETLTYSVVVNNTGAVDASATFTNHLPNKLSYVVGSAFANDGNSVNYADGQLTWSGTVEAHSAVRIQYQAITSGLQSIGEFITNIASLSDGAGATIQCQAQSIYNPGWGLSINDDALATKADKVKLTYHWDIDAKVIEMQISNDGFFGSNANTTDWLPVNSSNPIYLDWELAPLVSPIIPRSVYIRFRDANHKMYGTYSDDILYDTSAPVINNVSINPTAAGITPMSDQAVIRVNFRDDNSGVGKVLVSNQVSFDPLTEFPLPAAGQRYLDIPWTLPPSGDVYIKVVDQAGNESPLHDRSGPVDVTSVYLPFVKR